MVPKDPEKRRRYMRLYFRRRYHTDPEFRERWIRYVVEWRRKRKELES